MIMIICPSVNLALPALKEWAGKNQKGLDLQINGKC